MREISNQMKLGGYIVIPCGCGGIPDCSNHESSKRYILYFTVFYTYSQFLINKIDRLLGESLLSYSF
ncbi:MAG TPA: hypothetical protein ENI29_22380 [bacterium]|nr:hypothetical protein [archaeon]HEC41010.1 hypothetical protein [bacterium]